MIKLALPAAASAAFLLSGLAQASAQDRDNGNYYQYGGPAPILGEGGAHWGNQLLGRNLGRWHLVFRLLEAVRTSRVGENRQTVTISRRAAGQPGGSRGCEDGDEPRRQSAAKGNSRRRPPPSAPSRQISRRTHAPEKVSPGMGRAKREHFVRQIELIRKACNFS